MKKRRKKAPEPEETPSPFAGEDWGLRAWLRLVRDLYCSFDRRTLGFARILLGFLLIADLIHRGAAWRDMYSSVGVLPTPLHLMRPSAYGAFSIFNAFVSPGELQVVWVLMAINAVCLLVGYRTKLAQIVALVFHVGMNGRVLLIENGGYVVNNLLLLWTLFLPLGDRFSVDAVLASLRRRRETTAADLNDRSDMLGPGIDRPHVSVVGLVLVLQIAAIYYFNVIHKTGPAWRNGTAVYYVLYVDRMVTPLVSTLRGYIPNLGIILMTRTTMAFEAAIPVLLLQPLARTWARRGVIFMMCTLHLAFGTTFVLGPFAWSLCVFAVLLFSADDWDLAIRTMRRPRRALTVVFDPRSGGALFLCRLLKRLDRFELLTFAAEEGVPLGLGVRRPGAPKKRVGRAAMIASLVEALPLGPIVAWIPRLPGVKGLVDAACAALEKRDVSGFFGLRVAGPPGSAGSAKKPEVTVDPREPALAPLYGAVAIDTVLRSAVSRLGEQLGFVRYFLPVLSVVVPWWLARIVVGTFGPRPDADNPAWLLLVLGVYFVLFVGTVGRWISGLGSPRPPETTTGRALACVLALAAVPTAIGAAVHLDRPVPGVLLVLASVVLAGVLSAWAMFPEATLTTFRRAAFGSVREFVILAMFAGAVSQASVELWSVNKRIKVPQPEALRLLSQKMRFLQGWFMFSPNPLTEDGTIVVDAITVSGRHVDPFTDKEPYWDLSSKSLELTQIWSDYFNRIQLPANTAYREAMKEYMYRLPERTGRPEDAIVSGDVYWIREMNPRWNETTSYGYEKSKLFSFENPAAQPRASR